MHHAGVRPLLDHAGDDFALAPLELAEHAVVADIPQALIDDLLGGEGADAAEIIGAVHGLADEIALVVEFGHVHGNVPGLPVQLDAGLRGLRIALVRLVGVLQVGGQNRLLNDLHEFVERDLPLALHHPQDCQVDVHLRYLRYSIGAGRRDCAAQQTSTVPDKPPSLSLG